MKNNPLQSRNQGGVMEQADDCLICIFLLSLSVVLLAMGVSTSSLK